MKTPMGVNVSLISKKLCKYYCGISYDKPVKCPLVCNNCAISYFNSNLPLSSSLRMLEMTFLETGIFNITNFLWPLLQEQPHPDNSVEFVIWDEEVDVL